jgi:hypothetical protein
MPNRQNNKKATPQTGGQNPGVSDASPSGEHAENADESRQAANTEMRHKLAVVELQRHLLIETLRGFAGESWPSNPWRGGVPPKGEMATDPGESWPTNPWRGETLYGLGNTEDLQHALVEAEQHRHFLIEALHGVAKQIVVAKLSKTGSNAS